MSVVRKRYFSKQTAVVPDPLANPEGPRPDTDDEDGMPRGIWFGEWLGIQLLSSLAYVWGRLSSSAPMKALWRTWAFQYMYSLLRISFGILFQKVGMGHLDEVDFVGGPTRGLTAIVTGPTSGIGAETAAALARRGARVILACRDMSRGEALRGRIQEATTRLGHDMPEIEVWQLDLASLASVRAFSSKWEDQKRELHILINNAGIYSMGAPSATTEDGFESHMGCNHLGHFLLTLMLVPSLKRGAEASPSFGARIVNVSSDMHMLAIRGIRMSDPHFRLPKSYSSQVAYSQSKLANILFTKEMRRRLGPDSKLQAFAVHPGMVLTNVVRTLPWWIQKPYQVILWHLLLTPSQGSRASIYAATSPEALAQGQRTSGYFDANCRPMATSPAGEDMLQALWLWRWSAEQVQLPVELDLPEPEGVR